MDTLEKNIDILQREINTLIDKYKKLKAPNDDLMKENERLKHEIKKLQNANSRTETKQNIIIVKQPQNYENDGRFSDYVFRNPERRYEGVNESVEDFIKKNF